MAFDRMRAKSKKQPGQPGQPKPGQVQQPVDVWDRLKRQAEAARRKGGG